MFPSFRRDGFDTFGPGRSLRSASSAPGNTTTEYHENKTEIMGKILSFCLVLLWTIPTTAGNTWCPLQIEWFNTTTVEFYHDASKTYDMPYSGGSIQVVFYTPSTPTTGDAQTLQTNIRNRISSQGYSCEIKRSANVSENGCTHMIIVNADAKIVIALLNKNHIAYGKLVRNGMP